MATKATDPIRIVDGRSFQAVREAARSITAGSAPIFLHTDADTDAVAEELRTIGSLPEDSAVLMRTSGTVSGTGKIVVISFGALEASASASRAFLGGAGQWVTCLPTSHIAGFQTIFRSVTDGFDPIDAGRGTPQEIANSVAAIPAKRRANLSLVPTQLYRLLNSEYASAATRFDAILVGGAATTPSLIEDARKAGLNVVTTYGMTETCGGCFYNGQPLADTTANIDSRGQITVTGSVVTWGYVGHEPFSGKFTTGDIGTFEAGRLSVLGRADDAITTGGMTIMPSLIEAEVTKLGYGQCVVVGIPDAEWGEKTVAILENAAATTLPPLREALKENLDRTYLPAIFTTLAELGFTEFPLRHTGKIDRALLSRQAAAFSQPRQQK